MSKPARICHWVRSAHQRQGRCPRGPVCAGTVPSLCPISDCTTYHKCQPVSRSINAHFHVMQCTMKIFANDVHETIAGTAGNEGAVSYEVHATDWIRMRGQGAHHFARPHIPEEDSLVVRATDKHVPLWRELQRVDVIMMSKKRCRECLAL